MIEVAGREIEGHLVCPPVSTDNGKKPRWFTLELYALDDGNWLIHRTGWSAVYHAINTRCTTERGAQSGEPASVDDLPDDAVPCWDCNPPYPQDLPDGPGTIRFELPRHSWDKCTDPEAVYVKLTTSRSRKGVSEFVSTPVDQLLRAAAAIYPEFAPLLAA